MLPRRIQVGVELNRRGEVGDRLVLQSLFFAPGSQLLVCQRSFVPAACVVLSTPDRGIELGTPCVVFFELPRKLPHPIFV